MKKSFSRCLLIFMMISLFLLAAVVCRAEEPKGSVEVQLPAAAAEIELTVYRIAEEAAEGYVYSGDFADCEVVIRDLGDAEAAQEAAVLLADFAKEQGIQGVKASVSASDSDSEGGNAAEMKEKSIVFDGLEKGLYLIAQSAGEELLIVQPALVPIPYMTLDGVMYDAVITPKTSFPGGAVILNKVNEDGEAVEAAVFVLQKKVYYLSEEEVSAGAETGSDEKGNFYWKEFQKDLSSDANGQIVINEMPAGDYRLVEVDAPEGYVIIEPAAEFAITQGGTVTVTDGLYVGDRGFVESLEVVNQQTSVQIHKVDEEGNPLEGAVLVLKDAEGNVILDENEEPKYQWVSDGTPHEIKRLPAGEYFVSELQAPEGYQIAKDVDLVVTDEAVLINEATVVDVKMEETGANLRVKKYLVDMNDYAISCKEGVFYTALFADEERTIRVSDVKALHYGGSSESQVVFENLEPDTSYYVGETDAFGNVIDGGEIHKEMYTPLYPESYEVLPADRNTETEFEFKNVFYELPEDFYYIGELIVNKKVLKDGKPHNSDEVFYVGIFEDADFEELYQILTLDMDGKNVCTARTEVYVGLDTLDSMTYYIAEVDEYGVPVSELEDFGYEVTIDRDEVTYTLYSGLEAEVTITNEYQEPEETPTVSPTVAPTERPEGSVNVPDQNYPEGDSHSKDSVKTGDDSPIMALVVMVLAAVVLIALVVIVGCKRRGRRS